LWKFNGGATVAASSSPHNVKTPYSKPENVDPEEALLAALSSCHMLTFLYLAMRAGVCGGCV
jgi:organic hydroperoxide reductase OsmC/OhrA